VNDPGKSGLVEAGKSGLVEAGKSGLVVLRPHHVGLSVPNLEASIEWYKRILGFELEQSLFIDKIPAKVAFLKKGDFRLELFELEGSAPLPEERKLPNSDLRTHGTKHIAFAVADVDAAVEELMRHGVNIVMHARVQGNPMAFIHDNSGILVELIQDSP
jgi:methylmalonyl-CoA/ethylmalonyl-CoA epimerase